MPRAVAAPRLLWRRRVTLRSSFAGRAATRRKGAHNKCGERCEGNEDHASTLRVIDGDREQHVMAPDEVP